MPAEPLAEAAAARRRRAIERAERALRDLDTKGAQISFQSVARRAGVSRQWLYTQPALRAKIEQLRDRRPARANGVPTRQRATEASLRLRKENANLKTELAIAYGRQRSRSTGDSTAVPINGRAAHDT